MVNIIVVHDLKEANGRTIKENNLEKTHAIPIGTLVEINAECTDEHGTRQFVAKHTRDCDGSVMYTLTVHRDLCADHEEETFGNDDIGRLSKALHLAKFSDGWDEESLIVIS